MLSSRLHHGRPEPGWYLVISPTSGRSEAFGSPSGLPPSERGDRTNTSCNDKLVEGETAMDNAHIPSAGRRVRHSAARGNMGRSQPGCGDLTGVARRLIVRL